MVQVLLDGVNGLEALSETVRQDLDLNGDGILDTADVQILFEKVSAGFTALDVVKVPANGTATVHVTVTLTDADKAYMDEYYENGIYVDGFVRLYAQSEDAVDLSLPFMGFYGNWSDAKVFDIGWYYEGRMCCATGTQCAFYQLWFQPFQSGTESLCGWRPMIRPTMFCPPTAMGIWI